ncbi:hypothetical protein DPMN_035485 [Dreissena polymorpha]|uniref:Uncharacterized protein n=1 Tax=Dreissena polymorpha TaxID=45954 RepID=A0A9D4M7M4_DREPO|nr:hypothetical protein DPMN_035485 [Dreissena polymorpha]
MSICPVHPAFLPSSLSWRTVLHRGSCLATCQKQASVRRLTVASGVLVGRVPDVLVGLVFCVGDSKKSSETRTCMFKCLYSSFCIRVKVQVSQP